MSDSKDLIDKRIELYTHNTAYSRKLRHACCITKKVQERSVKGHNYKFYPLNFLNLGDLECNIPLNSMWFWMFLQKICCFVSQKGHKWLKEALQKQQKLINFGIEIPELHWFLIYKDNFSTYLGTNNKNITHLKCNIWWFCVWFFLPSWVLELNVYLHLLIFFPNLISNISIYYNAFQYSS